MKTLIDLITEQVTNAFTGQGYDAKYGKVTQWLQQRSTSVHHS